MIWNKKGLIFSANRQYEWMQTHAQVPCCLLMPNGLLRIYFGCRDSQKRTRTTFLDTDPQTLSDVKYVHARPLLELGKPGTFDDCGVMPSWVLTHENTVYLYYLGWNIGSTVRYRVANGLAVSTDGGTTFSRIAQGPIMDRTMDDPYAVSTQCVIVENGIFRTWYMSYTGWQIVNGLTEPSYIVKYAESKDGITWNRPNIACIGDPGNPEECISRPAVVKDGDMYKMWYSYRGIDGYRSGGNSAYRIGYAESSDGIIWQRHDDDSGITISQNGWDSEMVAYPCIHDYNGVRNMIYNGNGFGTSGMGYAVLEQ
jgi:hypothetical protein